MSVETYFSQKIWTDADLRRITNEAFAKKVWNQVSDLRGEFRTFSCFWGFCRALQHGARRLGNVSVKDEERVLAELAGIKRGADTQLRKPKV